MVDQAKALRLKMAKSINKNVDSTSIESRDKNVEIYAIASGKGGVGKTNFVVNLAIALQRLGKNVLIIDTDFGFANIDVVCGVTPKHSLQDVLIHLLPIEEAIIEGPEGIKILPGGGDALKISALSHDQQSALQKQFTQLKDVDVILVDTGAGISKLLILYIMFAKELIMVTTPEPTSLMDAYSFIKVMNQQEVKKRVRVVVNRVSNKEEASRTFKLLQSTTNKFLKEVNLELLGYIRDDKNVSESVKVQIPFIKKFPDAFASKDIVDIATLICERYDEKRNTISIYDVCKRFIQVFN